MYTQPGYYFILLICVSVPWKVNGEVIMVDHSMGDGQGPTEKFDANGTVEEQALAATFVIP